MKTIFYTLGIITVLMSLTLTSCSIDELEIQKPNQKSISELSIEESILNENIFKRDSIDSNKDGEVGDPKKDKKD